MARLLHRAEPMNTDPPNPEAFVPAVNDPSRSRSTTTVHSARLGRCAAALLALGFATQSVPGCAADDGAGASDSPAPVPLSDYCSQYAAIGCAAAERCDCIGGQAVGVCESYLDSECHDEVVAPVEAGRMAYHDVEAGRCLKAIEQIVADCSLEGDDYPAACDSMLTGQVAEGDSCDDDEECVAGLECVAAACVRLPHAGEPCADEGCASEHSCGDDGLCHAYAPLGGSCAGGILCGDELYCNEQSWICEHYLGQGDGCSQASWACDDDLYCSPASATCTPYPVPGQSCADSGGTCLGDAFCDTSAVCQPQQPAGSSCSLDEQCLSYDCSDGSCSSPSQDCPFL